MSDEKPTAEQRNEAREMARLETDLKLGEFGFGPIFEIDSRGAPFMAVFGGGPEKFTSCRGCGAVVRLGETVEIEGKPHIERGIWEHSQFHLRIGDPLKAVSEG